MSDFLTSADAAAAREQRTGRVYPLHRGGLVCCDQGPKCNQGRCPARMAAEAATELGADQPRRRLPPLWGALVVVGFWPALLLLGWLCWQVAKLLPLI